MEIDFKQWTKVDRADLMSMKLPVYDFIELLIEKLSNITVHSFIARAQSDYLKMLKETLGPSEVIMLGDFAENYSLLSKMKYKAITGIKVNVPFIQLSYITVQKILLSLPLFVSCLMILITMLVLSTKLWRQ